MGNFHSTSPVKGNIFLLKKERKKKKFEFTHKERKRLDYTITGKLFSSRLL